MGAGEGLGQAVLVCTIVECVMYAVDLRWCELCADTLVIMCLAFVSRALLCRYAVVGAAALAGGVTHTISTSVW